VFERDEARAQLAAERDEVALKQACIKGLTEQIAKLEAAAQEAKRKADDCRRQRVAIAAALDEVDAPRVDDGGDNMLADDRVEWACDALREARAQLATRPVQVEIDLELAGEVWGELPDFERDEVADLEALHDREIERTLAALRKVFGNSVNVAGPSMPGGDPYDGIDSADLTDEQLAEAARSPDERLITQLRADLADCQDRLKATLALADERSADKARVEHELLAVRNELQDAESGLDAKHAKLVEVADKLRALRSACTWQGVGVYPVESAISRCEKHGDLDAAAYIGRIQAALKPATQASLLPIQTSDNKPVLLKPATPEPQAPAKCGKCSFSAIPGQPAPHYGCDCDVDPPVERTDGAVAKPGEQLATKADVELIWSFLESIKDTTLGYYAHPVLEARKALDARKARVES
jgi:hypothetical protein